jgi:hypothetical protein
MHPDPAMNTTIATTKQQPVHDVRLEAINATIWENQTTAGTRHNVITVSPHLQGRRGVEAVPIVWAR